LSILRLAPKAATPFFNKSSSDILTISCHVQSLKMELYLCKRRLLSHAGISI
jgi:hypothetical protein